MPTAYFNSEVRILKSLDHINIVRYIGSGQSDFRKFIAMELCDSSLERQIQFRPNGFDSEEFKHFLLHLTSALKYLQSKNIVHRDIKPANILLLNKTYKISDFGSARIIPPSHVYSSIHGTFEYCHPELFEALHAEILGISSPPTDFDSQHELWSIGVTLYEVATGQLPFNVDRSKVKMMHRMIVEKTARTIAAKEVYLNSFLN